MRGVRCNQGRANGTPYRSRDEHCLNLHATNTGMHTELCVASVCPYLVRHGPHHDHDKRRPRHEVGSPQAANLKGLHVGTHLDQQRCNVVAALEGCDVNMRCAGRFLACSVSERCIADFTSMVGKDGGYGYMSFFTRCPPLRARIQQTRHAPRVHHTW